MFLAGAIFLYFKGVESSKIETHSFEPPYAFIDPWGSLRVSPDWKLGGDAIVS